MMSAVDDADLIVTNARITTLDDGRREATALAARDGRFVAVGSDADVLAQRSARTQVINANGRRIVPGLNDSHIHVIRGGLNYHLELRWDGVPSLADALRMLKDQAIRTPPPQWVRVVGGWSEFQFAERRMPTLQEINEAAPETPVFVLHLYDRAWLNGAALRAVGYTKDTPDPPGGVIERDSRGNPTGLLVAKPNANILYATLEKGPKLSLDDQTNSTRHFMRELNRLGLTSIIDAGGGFQNYPEDYQVIDNLHRAGQLTLRIAYNLFTQRPKQELADFQRWTSMASLYQGDASYRLNGAGEMLTFSAADFEDFLEPRPDLAPSMEAELEGVVRHLAEHRWPFRLHATYNESITRFLDVFERVHRDVPLDQLRWFFDHAETISSKNIERVTALGGGIAVQHRMAYQGESFVDRYGAAAAEATPPVRRMLEMGVPVGLGTDATRVASYNPWVALSWLVTGGTVGGLTLYPQQNRLDRETTLKLFTRGSAWMSREDDVKGSIAPGEYADFTGLSADYFQVPDNEIQHIVSVLTVVDGKVVYGAEEFSDLAPPLPPASPDWSPVREYGGYAVAKSVAGAKGAAVVRQRLDPAHDHRTRAGHRNLQPLWGPLGCACWAY
jgi:predicted amidohydrolase YtcJ